MPFPSWQREWPPAPTHFPSSCAARRIAAHRFWACRWARGVWLLWGLDAAITIGVATLAVALALRRPFCDACGSWYRATRAGRIDAALAAELAAALQLPNEPGARASYRLWTCRSGCGPMGCELSWSGSGVESRTVWLSDEARRQVVAILDRDTASGSGQTPP